MKAIRLSTITPATLYSCSIPEDDHPEWSASTAYALGDRVIRAATHRRYERNLAGMSTAVPELDDATWLDIGPTSVWAPFDADPSSVASAASSASWYVMPGAVNDIALSGVVGSTVQVYSGPAGSVLVRTATIPAVVAPATSSQVVISGLGIAAGNRIGIVLSGPGMVSVSHIIIGTFIALGETLPGTQIGIRDFSAVSINDFGITSVAVGAYSRTIQSSVRIATTDTDRTIGALEDLRSQVTWWVAETAYDCTQTAGIINEWSLDMKGTAETVYSITIDGLAHADTAISPGYSSTAAGLVVGATATMTAGGVRIAWNQPADPATVTEWRVGATWADGVRIFRGVATDCIWLSPPQGAQTLWATNTGPDGAQSAPMSLLLTIDGSVLTVGGGSGNQLFNADFGLGWRGWTSASSGLTGLREMDRPGWTIAAVTPISGNTASIGQGVPVGNPNAYCEEFSSQIPVTPLKCYCASAYTGAHRCRTAVFAYFLDATGAVVGNSYGAAATCENNSASSGGQDLAGYKRIYGTGQAPATARTAMLVLRKYDTAAGQASSYLFACRAMFEEVSAATSTPGGWAPGPIGYSGDLDATKGAPAGTYVGSQLAEQLVTAVQDINADSKWVPLEKAALIVDWAEINGSVAPLVAQANVFSIITERDAFTATVNALAAYLVGLSPGWNDTSSTTTIDRATADAKWAAAYNARTTLLAKIADEAGKRASWLTVAGRPTEQANLCWNGSGPTLTGWSAGVAVQDWGAAGYWSTSMGLTGSRYALTFLQRDSTFGDVFPVRKDDVFSFSADCVHSGAVTGGYATSIGLILYKPDGAVLTFLAAATLPQSTASASISGAVTIPSGAASAVIWVSVDGYSNFNSAGNGAHYTNIIVRRAARTADIVAGAVTESAVSIHNTVTDPSFATPPLALYTTNIHESVPFLVGSGLVYVEWVASLTFDYPSGSSTGKGTIYSLAVWIAEVLDNGSTLYEGFPKTAGSLNVNLILPDNATTSGTIPVSFKVSGNNLGGTDSFRGGNFMFRNGRRYKFRVEISVVGNQTSLTHNGSWSYREFKR